MKLEIADMIYNSKEIRDGEIRAIDFFLRMNYKIYQTDPSFQIEDLISDDFFQSESLKKVYDEFIEKVLADTECSENRTGCAFFLISRRLPRRERKDEA